MVLPQSKEIALVDQVTDHNLIAVPKIIVHIVQKRKITSHGSVANAISCISGLSKKSLLLRSALKRDWVATDATLVVATST